MAPPNAPVTPAPTPPVDPAAKAIKADLIIAAAVLTNGFMSKVPAQWTIDPNLSNPEMKTYMLMSAYVLKSYVQLCVAGENNTGVDADGTVNGWGDPAVHAAMGIAGNLGPAMDRGGLLALLQFLSTLPPSSFAGFPQAGLDALNKVIALIGKPDAAQPPSVVSGS
jgi:hypothetical protein